jgi:uracil-DNA glycosylase family 4
LIVGLAPGLHGANATGRPFTGDHAGILLYQSLYRFGFSDRPESRSADDGLRLTGCRITNAVKCVPPQNKPVGAEIRTCNSYLAEELRSLARVEVILALGLVAHQAVLRALSARLAEYRFAHGAEWALPDGRTLLDSYHCSRYNTQTGRLTEAAFHQVFERARRILDQPDP